MIGGDTGVFLSGFGLRVAYEVAAMIPDADLLRQYATQRDEAAFAELVSRHLPLVFSIAVRQLNGSSDRAADVAQTVFAAVACDARRPLPTTNKCRRSPREDRQGHRLFADAIIRRPPDTIFSI